ncbi:MAG: metalloregulator ArsR/SmtB family transcription factor [Planctomycetota bacterium]
MTAVDRLQLVLKLLSDPVRLRLLAVLHREELAVHELTEVTGLAQSRISNHLALLRRSGLVRDRREGTWVFYRTSTPGADEVWSPTLFQAVVQPFVDSDQGRRDATLLERVREGRRAHSRSTHDRLAARWAEVGQEFSTGALRAEAWSALVPAGLTVADLGCGAGYLAEYLAGKGARVIAVDHAPRMLNAARDRLPASVEVRAGEIECLPLADGEVDAAFANLVWHHLGDGRKAAREIARVLRPGGRVVVTDLLPHTEEWMREELGDRRLGLDAEEVMAALADAGFADLDTRLLDDNYLAPGKSGRKVAFPLFLVSGTRAAHGEHATAPS